MEHMIQVELMVALEEEEEQQIIVQPSVEMLQHHKVLMVEEAESTLEVVEAEAEAVLLLLVAMRQVQMDHNKVVMEVLAYHLT